MKLDKLKKIFLNNAMILLMNIIIFIMIFFILPLLIVRVNPIIWRIAFLFIIAIITNIFYLTKKIKYEQVLISLPILFILNLFILNYCTLNDLYGITDHGSLDKCPAIIDALMVDMIIVFVEYITLLITRFINKKIMKGKKI